ncbi:MULTISPECIES: hypothetical protein [Pantoea]|uniref:Uncharacterized protein n=1 Tax=Pantoea trifolii TaxID=2968030 RepID=A0ABT1VP91_9GAMM|nr:MULTISPECIES: hypothetical protein [unclassified Pantoea]MCQ8228976.1 hypothetical protein [Pantoea sp. MMK2]MCQ8237150.1 hypothetical protein [Pantoea sp. MMK3]MCW6031777.1 hypothetical protein [Pantoea sp. JK]
MISADTPLNPVGDNLALQGIKPNERGVLMDLRDRVGHTLGVGETLLKELLIT